MAKAPRPPPFGERVPAFHRGGQWTQADAGRARALLEEDSEEATESGGTGTELGPALRRLRRERGLTQRQLAERSGVLQSVISWYETKPSYHPARSRLAALARALDVPEAELTRLLPRPPAVTLVGRALRELREQRGLGRRQLAERSGVDRQLIAQYEIKGIQPSYEKLSALARVLRVPRGELRGLLTQHGLRKRASPFGQLVRKARLARGISRQELAQRVGLLPVTLHCYETTHHCPSTQRAPQLVRRLAAALDLDPELLERRLAQPRQRPPTAFGRRLRELRIDCGLTQAQLETRSGATRGGIGRYERGDSYPTPGKIPALEAALGVPEQELARLLPLLSVERELPPFARELRRWRAERGFTQPELAERAGIRVMTIRLYETARTHPSPGAVAALAKALGVDPASFERLLPARPRASALAQKLLELRIERGLSQREVADRAGCTTTILSNWELGRSSRVAPDWAALAAALGVPTSELTRVAPPGAIHPPAPSPLGSELARARRRLGLSQHRLARRAGLSRESISRYELGTAYPSPRALAALAEILGVPLRRLERLLRPAPNAAKRGRELRRLRQERGLTRSQLAARLGCRHFDVTSYELGRMPLPPEQLAPLARALGVAPEELGGPPSPTRSRRRARLAR